MGILYKILCFFGTHRFTEWKCKLFPNGQIGAVWLERKCADCPKTQIKHFR